MAILFFQLLRPSHSWLLSFDTPYLSASKYCQLCLQIYPGSGHFSNQLHHHHFDPCLHHFLLGFLQGSNWSPHYHFSLFASIKTWVGSCHFPAQNLPIAPISPRIKAKPQEALHDLVSSLFLSGLTYELLPFTLHSYTAVLPLQQYSKHTFTSRLLQLRFPLPKCSSPKCGFPLPSSLILQTFHTHHPWYFVSPFPALYEPSVLFTIHHAVSFIFLTHFYLPH